jgi:hypothetical protein
MIFEADLYFLFRRPLAAQLLPSVSPKVAAETVQEDLSPNGSKRRHS